MIIERYELLILWLVWTDFFFISKLQSFRMETMCGKSMLGSLYLSILLISCISFDFGSANSSGEETEGNKMAWNNFIEWVYAHWKSSIILLIKMTLNLYFLRNSSDTPYSTRMLQKCWCARILPWALHSCWYYGKTKKQVQRLCKIRCYHRWMLRSNPRLPSIFNFLTSISILFIIRTIVINSICKNYCFSNRNKRW